MTDPVLDALEGANTGEAVLDRLVERPELIDAVLAHEVASILEPETLDILRKLQAAYQEGGEVIVTTMDETGVRRYGALGNAEQPPDQ